MEYYVLENGQKIGPCDAITLIKKAKNGSLSYNSFLSPTFDGEFIKAEQVPDVKKIIDENSGITPHISVNLSLKAALAEGVDVWSRRIVDFSFIIGIILFAGFGLLSWLQGFDKSGESYYFANYVAATFLLTFILPFFGYALHARRSHMVVFDDIKAIFLRGFVQYFLFSAFVSSFLLFFALGVTVGVVATFLFLGFITITSYLPFLFTDEKSSFSKSIGYSIRRVAGMGADNFGVVFALTSINLIAAIIAAFIAKELIVIALFISLPITISALTYTYDITTGQSGQ